MPEADEDVKPTVIHFHKATEPFFFLSNSFPSTVGFAGHLYANAEILFQTCKFTQLPELKTAMAATEWPPFALDKAREWQEDAVRDWDHQQVEVMKNIVRLKFRQNPNLAVRLLETGDALLVHRNPDDAFWGVKIADDRGQNQLGRILEKIRTELKQHRIAPCMLALASPPPGPVSEEATSLVWQYSHAAERWYSAGSTRFEKMLVSPPLDQVSSTGSPIFLHGIAHGSSAWTITILIQVQERPKLAGEIFLKVGDNYEAWGDAAEPAYSDPNEAFTIWKTSLKLKVNAGGDLGPSVGVARQTPDGLPKKKLHLCLGIRDAAGGEHVHTKFQIHLKYH